MRRYDASQVVVSSFDQPMVTLDPEVAVTVPSVPSGWRTRSPTLIGSSGWAFFVFLLMVLSPIRGVLAARETHCLSNRHGQLPRMKTHCKRGMLRFRPELSGFSWRHVLAAGGWASVPGATGGLRL